MFRFPEASVFVIQKESIEIRVSSENKTDRTKFISHLPDCCVFARIIPYSICQFRKKNVN